MNSQEVIVVKQKKSLVVGLLLTFLFGPLGLLYSTVSGALVMIAVTLVLGFITFGIGAVVGYFGSIAWAFVAIQNHNAETKATLARVGIADSGELLNGNAQKYRDIESADLPEGTKEFYLVDKGGNQRTSFLFPDGSVQVETMVGTRKYASEANARAEIC